ncbi:MAG: hypothetical protein U0L20_00820 [Ruminococcus sp.]|nr:hypothetical protein [Ruminococcus sp.]
MKTKFTRIGKRSLAVVLTLMIALSTMFVGMVPVNAASGTITVYFKNTVGWSKVYAYFYSGSYWSDDKGSGANGIAGGPIEMSKVSGTTDVYSCTYTGNYSQYIAFTKDSQAGYGNFHNTSAVYRGDFSTSKPMYTPNTTSSGSYNGTTYYSNGTWSAYSSGGSSGGGDTPATGDYYLHFGGTDSDLPNGSNKSKAMTKDTSNNSYYVELTGDELTSNFFFTISSNSSAAFTGAIIDSSNNGNVIDKDKSTGFSTEGKENGQKHFLLISGKPSGTKKIRITFTGSLTSGGKASNKSIYVTDLTVRPEWKLNINGTSTKMNKVSGTNVYTLDVNLDNSGEYPFNVMYDSEDEDLYFKLPSTVNDFINAGQTNCVYEEPYSILNARGGTYTFSFDTASYKLTIAYEVLLSATANIPPTVYVGDEFSITVDAIPTADAGLTGSYTYYLCEGSTVLAHKTVAATSYTFNTSFATAGPHNLSVYVTGTKGDKTVRSNTITGEISVNKFEGAVTLSASTLKPFINETDVVLTASAKMLASISPQKFTFEKDGVVLYTGSYNSYTVPASTFTTAGDYTFTVTVLYNNGKTVSGTLTVTAIEKPAQMDVDIYFKTSSTYDYQPKLTVNGASVNGWTKALYLGPSYSGAVKFYWYKTTINVSTTAATTLVFRTNGTDMNATYKGVLSNTSYYFGVDNLMNGTQVVNLSAEPEYIRNYFHTALNMVYGNTSGDNTVGFTRIGDNIHKMGALVGTMLTVASVTEVQKLSASVAEYNPLQTMLFDANLDGQVNVKDATLIQKAIAGM